MDERTLFTDFWIKESATTRRVLARVPAGSTYRPDPRARTAQEIAWWISSEERLIIAALETGRFAWMPEPMPATMAEVLAAYDVHSAGMGDRWRALPEQRWSGNLDFSGRERSASAMARSFLFDIVYHRGQITTYLRPMGSTVPQVYGPTADEP